MIEIDHGYGLKTRYGHLHKISKKKGEMVDFREEIGRLGSSGRVTGPHLHYEVIVNNKKINSQKLNLPSGKILKGEDRKKFEIQRIKTDVLLAETISKIN